MKITKFPLHHKKDEYGEEARGLLPQKNEHAWTCIGHRPNLRAMVQRGGEQTVGKMMAIALEVPTI